MDERVKLSNGVNIKGFSSNYSPRSRKTAYIVVRYRDERSSELCQKIEEMAMNQGGIVLGGDREGSDEMLDKAFSSGYRTGLFHSNCRCRLVPKPKSMTGPMDDFDLSMILTNTAISHSNKIKLSKSMKAEHYEKFTSEKFKARVSKVVTTNISGAHYKHARRKKRGKRK